MKYRSFERGLFDNVPKNIIKKLIKAILSFLKMSYLTLTTRILDHVSQLNTQRISICIFIEQLRHQASRYSSDDVLIVR